MNTTTRRFVALALLAASAVVAGCGGGDADEPTAQAISPEVARYRALSEPVPAPAAAASAVLPG